MRLSKSRSLYSIILVFTALVSLNCSNSSSGPNSKDEGYTHTENPGRSAKDFLSNQEYSKLVIEVDYMQGYKPSADALSNLKMFLESRLNKTTISILEPTEITAVGQASYSANQIRELESKHRNSFTKDSTLSAYMIIVDGQHDQNNVLAIAYYNTSTAFFGGTYDDVSGAFGQPTRVRTESISYRHEFGHLLGLVNIDGSGTKMQVNHQDTEHGHHCNNKSCIMYYAMENAGLFDQFIGSSIPELDGNCIADLQGNGGK